MEKRNKIRIIFMSIFAILALIDTISTYFALENGGKEANPLAAVLINIGPWGYVLAYLSFVFFAGIMLCLIEGIFWVNNKWISGRLPEWSYSVACIYTSIMLSLTQFLAIIGNIGISIK